MTSFILKMLHQEVQIIYTEHFLGNVTCGQILAKSSRNVSSSRTDAHLQAQRQGTAAAGSPVPHTA